MSQFELLGDYVSQPTRAIFALATIESEKMGDWYIKEVNIGMAQQYDPKYKKINPIGKVPAFRKIEEGKPDLNMFESHAIMRYIV